METKWVVARYQLREMGEAHPHWNSNDLARHLGYSVSWVRKWLKRFDVAEPNDESVLWSKSRCPKSRQKRVSEAVERRILEIRDHPPDGLGRIPGPKTILYYLHHDTVDWGTTFLPRSTRTIWQILDRHQRIHRPSRPKPIPEERPEPMSHFQIDFKSISTVPSEEGGKKQHVVETFNVVDKGTSLVVAAISRGDYRAETVIDTMIDVFRKSGLPEVITFDRDPRFVGSWSMGDFPTPFMKMLMCLGIRVNVCPPHRPDKNAFVERYHRNYDHECLAIHRPSTLEAVRTLTAEYVHHYNWKRPNQAVSCGNLPPRKAWPELPIRPPLPTVIDPDAWLKPLNGRLYKRRVNHSGSIQIGRQSYYIGTAYKKQLIVLKLLASEKQLLALVDGKVVKKRPLKGLVNSRLLFEEYADYIRKDAIAEYRRYLHRKRR